jgi:hypothetical protein
LEVCNQVWQHHLSHQVQKKNDRNGSQFVDDEPFINKRKPSSTRVVKGVLNNGEHTLIPLMAKMIHSAIWDSERFVLKDGRPLHMVKLVGAVRNFHVNIKHVHIDVEDGTGLVQVILWKEQKECMEQPQMIHECNSNPYSRNRRGRRLLWCAQNNCFQCLTS